MIPFIDLSCQHRPLEAELERVFTEVLRGSQYILGPALSGFGVNGVLPDPQLRVFRGDEILAENNNWSVSTNATMYSSMKSTTGTARS